MSQYDSHDANKCSLQLAQQAEQKLAHASQFKEPLQPVDNFPNSFDDGEWTMGDLAHLDQVSNRLHEVLDEARSSQKTANAHLLELQNSCVKGGFSPHEGFDFC